MKTNYRTTDKVLITKPGMLCNFPGTILSNNTDTTFKPLCVILDNNLGTWQFSYDEVSVIGTQKADNAIEAKNSPVKPLKSLDSVTHSPSKKVAVKGLNKAENPKAKAGRPAKVKVEGEKPKRAYNRKVKA